MNDFKLMAFTRMCLDCFAGALGEPLEFLPSIEVIQTAKTDYCGKMMIYGNDVMEYATLALDTTNITILSEVDDISFEQALSETIYHEWIHFMHAVCHFDDYALLMCHEGELWDDMITLGMQLGFILREDI